MGLATTGRLKKQLNLSDVYVIATGAMFSSGFFLLPGIAAATAGPSVVLAYLLSGILIIPAMVSQAELATAMPRAGGAYYFLDRTMGPLVGTIGGVGTWLALMLKTAFALIGMGAYLTLFLDLDLRTVAVGGTLLFVLLNIIGARQSSGLVRILVIALLIILGFFTVHGIVFMTSQGIAETYRMRFAPFMPEGIDGLVATVGLVFISYVGLTNVASLAEEVRNPERNIPLGMILALVTVTTIYVVGVTIMVASLGTTSLGASLTPVADSAAAFFTWLPVRVGVGLVVVAAIAAFASMANTGIMAASRYPLAMARDGLAPRGLATVGRFHTPVRATLLTGGIIIAIIVFLDVVAVAKLASSLQLLLFALINAAVIVMRESRIETYDPGFRSPLYPWMQIAGMFFPIFLVSKMGWLPMLFSVGVMALGAAWYRYYAHGRLERKGAIFHVFERLGRRRFAALDRELRDIMKEKGVRAGDPFDEVVARAYVIDLEGRPELGTLVRNAASRLEQRLPVTAAQLVDGLSRVLHAGDAPISHGVALVHTRLPGFDGSEMVLVRCRGEVVVAEYTELARQASDTPIQAVFFLASGELDPGRHLRMLAGLAGRIEDEGFMAEWLADRDEQQLKETLLRDERFLSLELTPGTPSEQLIGRALKDIRLPEGSLVALILRHGQTIVPRGGTTLAEGDRITIIAEPAGLRDVKRRFGPHRPAR